MGKPDDNSKKRKMGRPRKLADPGSQRRVLAVLRVFGSRNDAAAAAGCDVDTLRAEMARDPEFAEQVIQAELAAKLDVLAAEHKALSSTNEVVAQRSRHFMLERKYYKEFSKQKPDQIPPDQLVRIIVGLADRLRERLPKKYHAAVLITVNEIADALEPKKT